jgi:hypothetical protein
MPIYNTKCKTCQKNEDRKLTFEQYDLIKNGQLELPCECGGRLQLIFNPEGVDFILSDGPSGGWVSKATKENVYRAKHRKTIAKREKNHVKPHTLQPNFQGQLTSTWAEARDLARQSTYEKIKGEQGVVAAAKAAATTSKTYDSLVK